MSSQLIIVLIMAGTALVSAVPTVLLRRTVVAARAEWIERADTAMSAWVRAKAELLTTREEFDAVTNFQTDWKTWRAQQKWLSDATDQWRQQNISIHNGFLRSEVSALTDLLVRQTTPDGSLAWPRQTTVETALAEDDWARLTDESNIRAWELPPDNHQTIRAEINSLVDELRRKSQQQAAETHAELFGSLETHRMTANQVDAVTSNESVNLVVAGAGSGKTSVMVARAAWLVASGQAEASEILLLAYNRAAAAELRGRLERYFGSGTVPECRTFHALGLSVLRDAGETGDVPVISALADEARLLKFLADWLTRRIAEEEAEAGTRGGRLGRVTNVVLICSPASAWSSAPEGYGPSPPDRDAPPHVPTRAGHNVRGSQEAHITNFMLMLGYGAEYEKPYVVPIGTKYEPDWYLGVAADSTRRHVYLEHFGIDRRGGTRDDIDASSYNQGMAWKRGVHHQGGTRLLETYTYDFTEGAWHARLAIQLHGTPLAVDRAARAEGSEFHSRIAVAARKVAGDLAAFIRVAREGRPDLDSVRRRLSDAGRWVPVGGTEGQWRASRNLVFLDLAREAVELYESALAASGEIDYADMCAQATMRLREESTRASNWKHILVDEFQDITRTRADLIEALLTTSDGDATLFAVGDDWQSIYAFAGADVAIMTGFASNFGRRLARVHGGAPESYANILPLDRTFRFPQNVTDVSGRFVMANRYQLPKTVQARPAEERNQMAEGVVVLRHPAPSEDDPNPARRVASRALGGIARHARGAEHGRPPTVMFLARFTHILEELDPASLVADLSTGQALAVDTSTVHASKGLEADYVVLAGVGTGRWGFPPDDGESSVVRLLLTEESSVPDPEERRLMYVALTRARRLAIVLAEESAPGVPASRFARELMGDSNVRSPEYSADSGSVVAVGDTRVPGHAPTAGEHKPDFEKQWDARWSRLRDSGVWGATVAGSGVQRGDKVSITAKDGRRDQRVVLKCIWEGDGKTLVALAPERALDGGPWLPDGCPQCGGDPKAGTTCWESGLTH